jgi:Domain of unknown function (DUF4465)
MKHSITRWSVAGWMFLVALGWSAAAEAGVGDFDDLALDANSSKYGPFTFVSEEPDPYGGAQTVIVGTFTSGNVRFTNRYAQSWGTATGFAYSNQTDTTTAGYANQYSAITGTGHGPGSDNYGVAFGYNSDLHASDPAELEQLPHFELPANSILQSAYVTNTTFTALTIRDGDEFGFSKPFGGDDGTRPDWFKLTVYATDAGGALLSNTVEFYLADYRSDSPDDDGYVDTWEFLDLSSLAGAKWVYFNLTSSDTGDNGMNTPGYFAIDDLQFVEVPEPASGALLALGAGLLAWRGRGFDKRLRALVQSKG